MNDYGTNILGEEEEKEEIRRINIYPNDYRIRPISLHEPRGVRDGTRTTCWRRGESGKKREKKRSEFLGKEKEEEEEEEEEERKGFLTQSRNIERSRRVVVGVHRVVVGIANIPFSQIPTKTNGKP